jgi:hypothetical protein
MPTGKKIEKQNEERAKIEKKKYYVLMGLFLDKYGEFPVSISSKVFVANNPKEYLYRNYEMSRRHIMLLEVLNEK